MTQRYTCACPVSVQHSSAQLPRHVMPAEHTGFVLYKNCGTSLTLTSSHCISCCHYKRNDVRLCL